MEDITPYGAVKANASEDLGKLPPSILADRVIRAEAQLEELRHEEDQLAEEYLRRTDATRKRIAAKEAEVREVAMELVRAMNAEGISLTTYRAISPRHGDYNHYTWIFEVDEHNELTVRKAREVRDIACVPPAAPRVEELGDTRVQYDDADIIPTLAQTIAAKKAAGDGLTIAEATEQLPGAPFDPFDAFVAPAQIDAEEAV